MTCLIFDLSGIFRRHWAAAGDQEVKHALERTLETFDRVIAEHKPKHVCVACDSGGKTFRHDIDPTYKAHRQSPDPAMVETLKRTTEQLFARGYWIAQCEGFEADDIAATVTGFCLDQNPPKDVLLVTSDKDWAQLVADYGPEGKVSLLGRVGRDDPTRPLGPADIQDKFGVIPRHIPEWLAMVGDSSDGIKGVKGIGEKGASKILRDHGELSHAVAWALEAGGTGIGNAKSAALAEASKDGTLSRDLELAKLRKDVPLDCTELLKPIRPRVKERDPPPKFEGPASEETKEEANQRVARNAQKVLDVIQGPSKAQSPQPEQPAAVTAETPQGTVTICGLVQVSEQNPGELFAAIAKAQSQLGEVKKDKKADAGRYEYSYADLGSTREALRPYAENGVAVIQVPSAKHTVTVLGHASGQWIAGATPLEYKGGGPQSFGSAATYSARYGVQHMCRMAVKDDDGAAAQAGGK